MRENWPAISSPLPNADFRLDSEGQFPRGVGSWSETWASRQSSGRLGGWEVLIPIWSLPWHLPLPSPHPNPSLRRVDSAPKSTWNLIMSHHACYPSTHDPAGAPTSLRAKAESSPWPARSAHPTPSLNATPSLTPLQPRRPPGCSAARTAAVLPQGLCTCYSVCPELFFPYFLQIFTWHHFLKDITSFFQPSPTGETTPSGTLTPPAVLGSSFLIFIMTHCTTCSLELVCFPW